jgi:RHS repeat-associated protein
MDTSGLYDMRAREYDPNTGRFLSQDPVAAAPADPYVADYVYANDNPVSRIDPSGQFLQFLEAAYFIASTIETVQNCYYGSKFYGNPFADNFRRDCLIGIGSLGLSAFGQGLARFGPNVPELAVYLYDELGHIIPDYVDRSASTGGGTSSRGTPPK